MGISAMKGNNGLAPNFHALGGLIQKFIEVQGFSA